MATVKAYMGELAVHTGDLDIAQAHAEEAIRLAKEAEARKELANATMVKGIIATKKSDWSGARDLFSYSQGVFQELGDKYNLGRVHAEQGAMYLERRKGPKDRHQAQEHLSKAHAIFTELGAQNDLDKLARLTK
jgi:hypothetical protein